MIIKKALIMTIKYHIVIFLSILLIGCSFLVDSEDSASISLCESNPCLNGSECIGNSETYACDCTDDWDGDNCEISNSLLVGNWEFYSATAFTNTTCAGEPFGFYYTDTPEGLVLFGNATNYQLNVIYDSDLSFIQTQILEAADGAITIDQNWGTITDTGTEKCITWDAGSSGGCDICSPYTITDGMDNADTLVTTNYCLGVYPCQIWTSIKQPSSNR